MNPLLVDRLTTSAKIAEVNRIVDAFRVAWRPGPTLALIEEHLRQAPEELRWELAQELVVHDALRRKQADPGITLAPTDYRALFPDREQLLEDALIHASAAAAVDATAAETPADGIATIATARAAAPVAPPDWLLRHPDFEILGTLGQGGMGAVFKARQRRPQRIVAIKVITAAAAGDPEFRARFQREADTLARVNNPNIVQIHHYGEHDGQPYFLMEYVDGGSWSSQLRHEPQPPRLAASALAILARSVQAAHDHGIIHRDLKPANVLISGIWRAGEKNGLAPKAASSADPGMVAATLKITDFGLAKQLGDAGQTEAGVAVGTPSYMAPEQVKGVKELGPAVDNYGLGAVLYELLTGRPPFVGSTAQEIHAQIIDKDPVSPRRVVPSVPRDLETICLKCLEKEQGKRYASAEELAEDLERYLRGEPIKARPIRWMNRAWRWSKRYPARATLIVSIVLLVALSASAGLWYREDRNSRALEDAQRETQALRQKSRAELDITAALQEAETLFEQAKQQSMNLRQWEKLLLAAEGALQRAVTIRLARLDIDTTLVARIEGSETSLGQEARDQRLVAGAFRIRREQAEGDPVTGLLRTEESVPRYRDLFAQHGFRAEMNPKLAAAQLVQRRADVLTIFVAALDDWHFYAAMNRLAEGPWLRDVLAEIDPNDWRQRVRRAFIERDRPSLKALCAHEDLRKHHPTLLVNIAKCFEPKDGIHLLRRIQVYDASDFFVHFDLGYYFDRKVKPPVRDDAIGCYIAALALDPANGPYVNLANAWRAKGNFPTSIAVLENALARGQSDYLVYFNLGQTLRADCSYEKAIAACRKAIELPTNRDQSKAYFELAESLTILHRVREALAVLDKGIHLFPKSGRLHIALTRALINDGQFEKATITIQRALELLPIEDGAGRTEASSLLAVCKMAQDAEEFIAAIRDGKKDFASLNNRLDVATMWYAKKHFSLALRLYEQALAAQPDSANHAKLMDRLRAACVAVQLALTPDAEAEPRNELERTKLLSKALRWLQADLDHWKGKLITQDDARQARKTLYRMKNDPDLASVRESDQLALLSLQERTKWTAFWGEVQKLLDEASSFWLL